MESVIFILIYFTIYNFWAALKYLQSTYSINTDYMVFKKCG